MKIRTWVAAVLAIGLLVLTGCGKSQQQPQGAAPVEMRGVKVDIPKLQQVLPPEKQTTVGKVMSSLRYGLFPQALADLQTLSADPSLTEEQKKVVNDVIDQVKQMEAKNSPK